MGPERNIQIGDWVTCYYAGYWQVVEIKHNLGNSQFSDLLAIVKKGFTPSMKFGLSLKFCDIDWCKKISGNELYSIENYFKENPDKKRAFDAYDGPLIGIAKGWVVDVSDEEVKIYNDKIKTLPKYFSIGQFNRLAEETGLRKHMYPSSKKAKYLLTVMTYPWLTDEKNKSPLYFSEGIVKKPQTK